VDIRPTPHQWVRVAVIWLIVCLGVTFLYLVFVARNLDAITNIDALDYAQIARNLSEGKGFTTDFIKPLSLTRFRRLDGHPDMVFPPLHPFVTSVFMRLMGANKRAVALACGLPFLLTLLVIYFLGQVLFDKRVAILGAALFGDNLWTERYSISGLEVCLVGLLLITIFLVLYLLAQEPKKRAVLAVALGVLLGLIYLTKYIWILILLPVLVYVWFSVGKEERWKLVGAVVAVFIVVILPWCIRNQQVAGNPLFSWRWYEITMETMTNPGNTLYRSYRTDVASPLSFALIHPREMLEKVRKGGSNLYAVLCAAGGPYAVAFFIVAILVPLGGLAFERLRYLVYVIYLLMFLALVVVLPSQRMLYPLGPIVVLIAAACFYRVLTPRVRGYAPREQYRYTALAVGVLIFVQAFPLMLNLTALPRPGERSPSERAASLAREVAEATTGPIIADVPWWTAWYGHQTSIWLPRSWDDLDRLQQDIGQVSYLLLTPTVVQWRASERTQEWVRLWSAAQSGRPVTYRGFTVYKRLGDNWIIFRKVSQLPRSGSTGAEVESGAD